MMLLGASRFSSYDDPERADTAAMPTTPPINIGDDDDLDDELAPLAEAALSASLPASGDAVLDFPLAGVSFRSLSDGGVPSLGLGAVTTDSYDAMHLSLGGYRDDPFLPRSLAGDARRRRTDHAFGRQSRAYPHSPVPPLPALSLVPPPPPQAHSLASEHDRRKEIERKELIEMILESVASVPMALEKIHTNARLRAALEQEMGGEHSLLHRVLRSASTEQDGGFRDSVGVRAGGGWSEMQEIPLVAHPELADEATAEDDDEEDEEDEEVDEDSSDYDSEYENDLAEAVNQLVMTEATLSSAELQISVPMAIYKRHGLDQSSNRTSNSPQSSIFGASPGASSQDGEPTAALWPRQPHQFAFTQEEEEEEVGAPVQDEVYAELAGTTGEDEAFLEEEDDDGDGDAEQDHILSGLEKVFAMDDGDEQEDQALDYDQAQHMLDSPSPSGSGDIVSGFTSTDHEELALTSTGVGLEEDEDEDVVDEEEEYEVFELRIFREKERTGFEANEDWRPRIGSLVGGRYRVQMEIGEAVFSRTYKGKDTLSDEAVCLKIIKNSKEYFDQGIDEIRVLQYIATHCDVDEKHLVRLRDFFYFREHLIIVTELLRDNLYEFSKLLLERGNINYFSMPRLKKVAIEVLEALDVLHSLGLVHCDLKPENILISNFNECRIKVIDFGSACFVTDELTSYVQSRSYRAPEVILGLGYDHKIDLWSLGCVLAELFTGDVLFKNDSEQSLLERIIGAIGPIPHELLLENSELDVQFRENPSFAMDPATGNGVLSALHASPPTLEALVQTSDAQFLDFLRALLQIHPNDRVSAAEALQHPWLESGVFSRSLHA